MSGLAAVLHRNGRPADADTLWAMLAAVPYRGPDGMWLHLAGHVGLGQAKLAVTPEEEIERQPLVSSRSGCVIVADVRLDNRAELLAALGDQSAHSMSDTDLILRTYETWGADATARLLGDFAFVLWDPRRQRMICARDSSGQRSLFYRADSRTFAAASEIHQLLQDPSVPIRPNEEHIRNFLTPSQMRLNEKEQPTTFFDGILEVPAGHLLIVDQGAVRLHRYWELLPRAEIRYRNDDEYAEHYRALLFEAVKARLRSSRPIGATLSGGLDSSSVVCTVQELFRTGAVTPREFISFSFVFDGLDCDERHLIQDVPAKYGHDARYVTTTEFGDWLQLHPQTFFATPNSILSVRDSIHRAACQSGVRALLTGEIADSCVMGSPLVFDSLLRRGDLLAFRRHLRAYQRTSGQSLRKTILLDCLLPLLPLGAERMIAARYQKHVLQRFGTRMLPPWMAEPLRQDLWRRNLRLATRAERARRYRSPARELDYRALYPPEVVRHPTGFPLQLWQPFADRRLHEFLLAIPPEQKYEPHPESDLFYAGSKRLARRALHGILPESIRTQTGKTTFSAVFEDELARRWPVYESAFGPGGNSEIAARGYVDRERYWERLRQTKAGLRGTDFNYITRLVGLETWLRVLSRPRPLLVTPIIPRLARSEAEVVSNVR